MISTDAAVLATYLSALGLLAIHGWHRVYLVYLYTKYRAAAARPTRRLQTFPFVTIQLPLYNELYVAERLLDAVCGLEYPRDRFEIQVLDDSTDETSRSVAQAVRRHAATGVAITHLRRGNRIGFKAGALDHGLEQARGAFIAIFDADFVPHPGFLLDTLPAFDHDRVGMVQARWGHINEAYSLLTRVQAIMLDGHFVLEHGGRQRAGCFFNFNGTAGVWRRSAILDAGGWQHDTLTEDLDLSYRAQLRGWRFVFLPDVVTPAELPVEMNAFKSQQYRWAKGSVQTCLKLMPQIVRADLPMRVKIEACFHLTANVNHVLMLVLSLLVFPSLVARHRLELDWLLVLEVPLFLVATLSFVNFYLVSQRAVTAGWLSRLRYVPGLMAVGIGLCVNNSRAVVEALVGYRSDFVRTPKYGVEGHGDRWAAKRYRQSMVIQPLIELALGVYFSGTVVYAASLGLYATVPFLMLFQIGFLYTGLLSVVQQRMGTLVSERIESGA